MTYAIVVESKTGNTRKLADALARELGSEVVTADDSQVDDAIDAAGTVLAGFWCDKGDCSPAAARVLARLSGKQVFLFGTAGFGGSAEYFDRVLGAVEKHLPDDAELLGTAMCQGQIAPASRGRWEAALAKDPEDKRAKMMLATYDAAAGHPTEADVAHVVAAAKQALGR